MNKNDYYSKYLKYKMKYLREKSLQIGGVKINAFVQIFNKSKQLVKTLKIVYDNEKTIGDIKKTIFEEIKKEYTIDKQIFQYKGITPNDTDIYNKIYKLEPESHFTVYIS